MSAPPRPAVHVSAPAGWLNDPLGVTWHESADGGRYELFVQYNPDAPQWVPACRWAQLTGPDLVHWSWVGTALEPGAGEDGCWSGAVVVADDGAPVIVYTSVLAGTLDAGRIALAHGDPQWQRWTPDPGGPVLDGPPPGLGMTHFRDPFVWRTPDWEWRMVVGGGRSGGRAAAVQYSSPDLRSWRFDGVVAERSADERGPLPTGSVWECVQLFPLEGSWVLLVSAWDDGSPQRVAYAVGDYDGRRFVPRSWRPFTATEAVYATTTFDDAAGRRCALSWIREPGPAGGAWAGVLTLPVVLSLDGDRVLLAPHPDVAALRGQLLAEARIGPGEAPVSLGALPPHLDVEVAAQLPPGARARLELTDDGGDLLTLVLTSDGVTALRPGCADERAGAPAGGAGALRLILDADVAEVFPAGDSAVLRLRPGGATVDLRASAAGGAALDLRVHGLRTVFAG